MMHASSDLTVAAVAVEDEAAIENEDVAVAVVVAMLPEVADKPVLP